MPLVAESFDFTKNEIHKLINFCWNAEDMTLYFVNRKRKNHIAMIISWINKRRSTKRTQDHTEYEQILDSGDDDTIYYGYTFMNFVPTTMYGRCYSRKKLLDLSEMHHKSCSFQRSSTNRTQKCKLAGRYNENNIPRKIA